jgi:hypothetical protein
VDELFASFGDIASVWSLPAFVAALVFGLGFGYVIIVNTVRQPRWRTNNSPRFYASTIALLAAWFLAGFFIAEAVAAILERDPGWIRIVSRIGPAMVTALGVGVGVGVGLRRRPHR